MPADIQITFELGIIRVTYRGVAQFDLTTGMLRDVARVAAENDSKLLLLDVREGENRNYHADAISHTQLAPAMGIDHAFRIAFLGTDNFEMVRYIEDVTVNRGFRTKAFTDEAEALAWLRSTP
jgi:hypothetical protein